MFLKGFMRNCEAFFNKVTHRIKSLDFMKLFRTIRRKLLESGKFKSYLIYAFGEILLIVVGISIAWKINNLNDIRKNNIVELKIYESLYEELNTNLRILESSIYNYTNGISTLENTLSNIGKAPNILSQESKKAIIELNYTKTILRNEALNSLNNTSKFEFVQSDVLKELIATYPNEIDNFENQEIKIESIIYNRIKPVIEKHISLIEMLPENFNNSIKIYGKQSDYTALLANRDYQNSVIDRLMQTKIQLNIAKGLKHKTETIATKLSQVIN